MSYPMAANLRIYSSMWFFNEFRADILKRDRPDIQKVIYYIHPFQYHDPPNPNHPVWANHGLTCEIRTPPTYPFEQLEAELHKETYDVPTLVIVQRRISW